MIASALRPCPCCGSLVSMERWQAAFSDLPPAERRLAEIVHRRPGLSGEDLAGAYYAGRADGGPETAVKVMHIYVHRANRRLSAHGFRLRGRADGYRIEVIA